MSLGLRLEASQATIGARARLEHPSLRHRRSKPDTARKPQTRATAIAPPTHAMYCAALASSGVAKMPAKDISPTMNTATAHIWLIKEAIMTGPEVARTITLSHCGTATTPVPCGLKPPSWPQRQSANQTDPKSIDERPESTYFTAPVLALTRSMNPWPSAASDETPKERIPLTAKSNRRSVRRATRVASSRARLQFGVGR